MVRWWRKPLPRLGETQKCPKSLEETPVWVSYKPHLWQSFSGIPGEVGDIESEWSRFKASIAEAAYESCGLRVIAASRGGNPQDCGGLWLSGKLSD